MRPDREFLREFPLLAPYRNSLSRELLLMASIDLPDPSSHSRADLRANCGDCFALCCTAFGFQRSADFAIDKPAGTACRNLSDDFACTIHDSLSQRGFRGCTVFDCFGAGQFVSQQLFDDVSWRESPATAPEMFAAFALARQLHEMLWHLTEASARAMSPDSAAPADELRDRIAASLAADAESVLATDVSALHEQVRQVLIDVSAEVRGGYQNEDEGGASDFMAGSDHAGADLRAMTLGGADLRGACLIAADLRGMDLSHVDLLGADLRDARLEGADLSAALFVTQSQIAAARGDARTALPQDIARPRHWHRP